MKPSFLISCIAVWLALAAVSRATVMVVAPDGRDDNDGSAVRPFATLERARAEIRAWVKKGLTEDVTVQLRGGAHRLAQTLELTPEDIGDGKFAVIFAAERGGRAVIAGSRELGGTWQRVKGDLWSLAVPDASDGKWVFHSLFRGGQSLPPAREPNTGFFTVAAVDQDRRRLTLKEKLPATWHDLTGVQVLTTASWHFNRQPAAEITETSVTGKRPIGTDVSSAKISGTSHSRVWLENGRPFVDAPGEWFLDTAKGTIFYFAPPGDDPNQSQFSAPRVRELIVFRGTAEKPVRNVHFQGIEFAETDWELPAEGRLGVQAGAWAYDRGRTYSPDAALRFIFTDGAAIESCSFRDLGDGAISFEIGSRRARVIRCDFRRVGSNVIQVGRMPEYTGEGHPLHLDFKTSRQELDGLKQIPSAGDIYKTLSARLPEAPAQIKIADNTIVDCGTTDYGSVGIMVGYAHHVTIEHNLLQNLPYTAISVGWRWAPGLTNAHSTLIAHNRIEHIMQQAGDGGGVYLMGEQPGTRVINNFIRDSGKNYWSHGVYTDEFSDHMEIAGNYVVQVIDHSIFMNKNGPNQVMHDNNGEKGPTLITDRKASGGEWVTFKPERMPPDLSAYGPRQKEAP